LQANRFTHTDNQGEKKMTFSVTMPALGESVSEGTVTRWLKAEGDHVNVDEPLLEVSTDKVDTEIPSPVSGTLQKIVVQIDQTVPVGAELAIIADGAAASAPAPAAPVAAPVVETPAPVAAAPVTPPPAPAAPAAPATSAPTGAGTVITMPALGESVSEGTVTRWLKNVGDSVAVDEALLEVSTDKVDTEIPSPVAGTLLAIDVAVDTTVPVGARLGLIGAAGGAVSAPAAPVAAAPVVAAPVTPTPAPCTSSCCTGCFSTSDTTACTCCVRTRDFHSGGTGSSTTSDNICGVSNGLSTSRCVCHSPSSQTCIRAWCKPRAG
jgi:pyruvate dehydrogenase E2 component (dihydrolipoamide acetyltransferase)